MKLNITEHLKTAVVLESVGKVEVSTINLSQSTPYWTGYETCLFWGRSGHNSEVVETYSTWQEAVQGHERWINPEAIANCLTRHVN